MFTDDYQIQGFDDELYQALQGEDRRQEEHIELIASENYASPRVLAAQGSVLTNKYAEGYPGRRYYGGCEFVDVAETLAIERAKTLFGADYANVQPHSGSQANAAAYLAMMEPGDTLLGMSLPHGGHLTHGAKVNFSGKLFNVAQYGIDEGSGEIDYDAMAALAREHQPKVIVAGFSAYSRIVDWQRFREVADEVGAFLMVDMAHVAGLVAVGLYPNPVQIADVTTTTTHKTLRGPRGGMILARENPPVCHLACRRVTGIDDAPFHRNATDGREANLPGLGSNGDEIGRVGLGTGLGVDAIRRKSVATRPQEQKPGCHYPCLHHHVQWKFSTEIIDRNDRCSDASIEGFRWRSACQLAFSSGG